MQFVCVSGVEFAIETITIRGYDRFHARILKRKNGREVNSLKIDIAAIDLSQIDTELQ